MPQFVLRSDGDETNPTLARVYGPNQSTRGRVDVWERDGDRTKAVVLLCNGGRYGCDGINELHFQGFNIPEFEPGHDGDEAFRNWKFYPGTRSLGYDDPIQGRSWCFPALDETYSFICHVDVKIPADLSPGADEVPTEFEIFMRGLKVMRYDLVEGQLEETTPALSENPAWVGLDIWREVDHLPLSRFQPHAPSWKQFQEVSDILLSWDMGGDFGVVDIPQYQANCVFSSSSSPRAAFQTVIDRCPGVKWFDADGGIGILPSYDRDPVHPFNPFNILRKGVTLTPPDPSQLYSNFLFLYRDIDDVSTDPATLGQLLYRQNKVEIDLYNLRDSLGGRPRTYTVNLGGGPLHQSQVERLGWWTVRNMTAINAVPNILADNIIYPTRFNVKGQMDSFHVTQGDHVEIRDHHMVGLGTPLCNVKTEVTHGKRGERTFAVQLTARDAYRPTDHTFYQPRT
jgi:hypothetical protein